MAQYRRYRYIIIKAVRTAHGYVLKDNYGNLVNEGYLYNNAHDAYRDCAKLYPHNSVWEGEKIASGYRIMVE